jgi:hypothetical protein
MSPGGADGGIANSVILYYIYSINIQVRIVTKCFVFSIQTVKCISSNFRQEMLYFPSTLKIFLYSNTIIFWTTHFHWPVVNWNLLNTFGLKKLLTLNRTFWNIETTYLLWLCFLNQYCYGPAYWSPDVLNYEATKHRSILNCSMLLHCIALTLHSAFLLSMCSIS